MALTSTGGVRISPQQRRIWELLASGGAYGGVCALSAEGPLDGEALGKALADLVERHEILRTSYRCPVGMTLPVQVVAERGAVRLDRIDLAASGPDALQDLLRPDGNSTAGLAGTPELRAMLASLGGERWLLVIRVPALGADAAGLRLLARELVGLYAARRGEGDGPADAPVQYADLSEWLNEVLEAEESAEGREFWRRSGRSCRLAVPLPEAREEGGAFQPVLVSCAGSTRRGAALEAAAQALGAEPAEILLACWLAFLGWRTGRAEVHTGVLLEGRDYVELEISIGPLARVVPLTAEAGPLIRFTELVAQVRLSLARVRSRQECFSRDLLAEGGQQAAGAALLPFCFEHREEIPALAAAGVRFTVERLSAPSERCDLKWLSWRCGGTLILSLEHDASRLSPALARHLLERLDDLVGNLLDDPHKTLGDAVSLGPVELHRLLRELNDTSRRAPLPPVGVHRRFEQRVVEVPDLPALSLEGGIVSYGELDALANRLAGYLERLGVGRGDVVPLCLESSLDLVVSLLAVLKAGAAYAPLDPAQPGPRLAAMVSDLAPRAIVARERWLGLLPQGCRAVCLDRDREAIAREEAHRPSAEVAGEDLAYVIFTSGSTGCPKGVAVEHRQLLGYVDAVLLRLALPPCARFGMVSTFAADLGYTVLFPALVSGGCLDASSLGRASDPEALAKHFQRAPVDVLKIVPSHLRALLASVHAAAILPRRLLVLGGEASTWELIEQVRTLAAGCAVLNHYGPTETTVGVLTFPVRGARNDAATVPIGRPLENSAAYLLDSAWHPVPAGVAGEIFVGGRGVARGYLGNPAATAERFVPDPFSTEPGARLYRTGDLARQLPDGPIEFLGRADHQVKIRGFRIELAEIEAALERHPAVRQVVVAARPYGDGLRLVAYVVPAGDQPTLQDLRDHAARHLPDFMAPALYVLLEAMPLTTNGKIARNALPDPDKESLRLAGDRVPPRNRAEEILAATWSEVLGLTEVGVFDNFFDLGGDSILSIKIVARANQQGLRLLPRQLFEHQTIAALAAVSGTAPLAEAEQGPVVGPVPMTPIQLLFFEQELTEPWHWNQSLLLEVRRRVDAAILEEAVRRLVEHHDALRLRFIRQAAGWVQHNAPPDGSAPFSRIDLSAVTGHARAEALERAATQVQRSLDLAAGPPLRVVLFHGGPGSGDRLLLVLHHLVVDGVSWRILLEDLETCDERLARGEALTLPPKTTSFKSWAQRLAEHAQSAEALSELDLWLRPPGRLIQVPVDVPSSAGTIASLRSVPVAFEVEETRALLQEVSVAFHARTEEILLAALARAARLWDGEGALRIDLEGHGREDLFANVDLSRTVGWLTTVYPVVLGPVLGEDPGADIKKVKEQIRAVPRRGIHFGVLRFLGPADIRERMRALPRAEVRFNYLGQLDQILAAGSLFAPAAEPRGDERSPSAPLPYRLDVVAWIAEGRLQMSWGFSEGLFHRRTVESMAEGFVCELRALLERCLGGDARVSFTPSDFPDAGLTQEGLDRLLDQLEDVGEL